MELLENISNFTEHEQVFTERTGNTFSFFYTKYYPKLIYYTNKMCRDQQKAEDITFESFMTAFKKIDKYEKEKSQFSTWLFTIARNIILQDIKSQKKEVSIDTQIDEDGNTLKDFLTYEEGPRHNIDLDELKAEIMLRKISLLKEPYRTVIEMREIRKMAYKDIADLLGKNLSTIKSQIRNGRAILIKETKADFDKLDRDVDCQTFF
ncbi:sigma-70 family RNA polymerase sigma factor [bacterium]|nr:sigma-70 family RNA polymerase sigma factor [Candidatus Elulimicrobium humile]